MTQDASTSANKGLANPWSVFQQSEMVGHSDRRADLGPLIARLPLIMRPEIGQLLQINRGRHSTGPDGQAEIEGVQGYQPNCRAGLTRDSICDSDDLY